MMTFRMSLTTSLRAFVLNAEVLSIFESDQYSVLSRPLNRRSGVSQIGGEKLGVTVFCS